MSIDLSTLNESQTEAVKWQDGPVLVVAGPGSGKTRVLTLRIARLIGETPDSRFRVLGVTFTNKAAAEMRKRIDALISDGRDRATLTTFHSFAAEILRQHGSHVGLKPDFAILSEQADREAVLAEAIRSVHIENDDFTPKAAQLLPTINRLQDECVLPTEAHKVLARLPHANDLAKIYAAYRDCLIHANQMDFGTLLAVAVDLLEKKPAIAKQIRRIYTYVCVDECQDTNSAQYRLLVQLVPETAPNLFVVADDDQLIYQWNGASPARLQTLRHKFDMTVLQLPENYRCQPEVIELANNLIRHNSDRVAGKKPLTAHKQKGGMSAVTLMKCKDFEAERLWIAEKLSRMPPAERAETAVLARRKKLLEETMTTLEEKGIPAHFPIRKNEFESAPYRWLHATLRLTNAPNDREQLRRMTKAFFEMDGVKIEVEDVVARAAVDQAGLLRSWFEEMRARKEIEAESRRLVVPGLEVLLDRVDYWGFIRTADEWFGKMQKLRGATSESSFEDYDIEKAIWAALQSEITTQLDPSELSLHRFLQELDLHAKETPAPRYAVRCLTIAASKGMEFKHVLLIGLVEDELPSYYARKEGDASDQMREERRNCFVAITRAEETLTLTYADEYSGYSKEPSRFLKEMGFDVD